MRDYEIFTLANDFRISDLAILLESNKKFDNVPVNIIPFDDELELVHKLAKMYNSSIHPTNTLWDIVGKRLTKDYQYRPNALAWRYFRKLNAFQFHNKNFLYVDANCVILNSLSPIVEKLENYDFIFGAKSHWQHNFNNLGNYLIKHFNPNFKTLNTGFFFAKKESLNLEDISELSLYSELFQITSTDGEKITDENLFNLAILFQKKKFTFVSDIMENIFDLIDGTENLELVFNNGEYYFQNKKVFAIKWTGLHHFRNDNFNFSNYPFYKELANSVLKKVYDPKLLDYLTFKYKKFGILGD